MKAEQNSGGTPLKLHPSLSKLWDGGPGVGEEVGGVVVLGSEPGLGVVDFFVGVGG